MKAARQRQPVGGRGWLALADLRHAAATPAGGTGLTAQIRGALLRDADLRGSRIHIFATGADVQLSGLIVRDAQRDRAVELVRGLAGVARVREFLMLDPHAA